MRIAHHGVEHFPVFLYAVGKRIVAKDLSGLSQIVIAEDQTRRNALSDVLIRPLLGLLKGIEQVQSNPRLRAVEFPSDHVNIHRRDVAMLLKKPFALVGWIWKKRFYFAPVPFSSANAR